MDEMYPYETGFFIAPNEVFDIEGLNVREKLVLYYLVRCANNHSKAFPSYNTIARKCSVSRVTAIETVKSLVSKKLLAKVERKSDAGDQTSNLYKVMVGSKEALPGSTGHVPPPSTPHVPPSTGDVPYKELSINNYNSKKKPSAKADCSESFERFWKEYPNKNGKKPAYEKYVVQLKKKGVTEETLITAAKAYAKACQVNGTEKKYIKQAQGFLNGELYNDHLPKAKDDSDHKPFVIHNENHDETEAFEAAYGQLFKKP